MHCYHSIEADLFLMFSMSAAHSSGGKRPRHGRSSRRGVSGVTVQFLEKLGHFLFRLRKRGHGQTRGNGEGNGTDHDYETVRLQVSAKS